jgi:hypothetical protein
VPKLLLEKQEFTVLHCEGKRNSLSAAALPIDDVGPFIGGHQERTAEVFDSEPNTSALYRLGGVMGLSLGVAELVTAFSTKQSEKEIKLALTKKSICITSAMIITLSLPLAQAAGNPPYTVTVADMTREMLAKKTLKQVQASAAAVADEADQLRMIANPAYSPDSHLATLTALKDDVNRMGQGISRLKVERESLATWEQMAVDQVLPLLQATAANTECAIEYFNANSPRFWTMTYRDYADQVWQDSEQISTTLKSDLKYDKLRDEQVQVEERSRADSRRNAE